MKFYEKLIILRKKALLSQEALAEKLDVTRQTVSTWELGQTKPDIDKLNEISKLFSVDINVLTNDEVTLDDEKKENVKKEEKKDRTYILYIAIVILVLSISVLVYRVGFSIKDKYDTYKENAQAELRRQQEEDDKIKKQQQEETAKKEAEKAKNNFNRELEFYIGSEIGNNVGSELDRVIKSNKTSTEHLVEVVFDGVSCGYDTEKIKNLKSKLKNFKDDGTGFQYYEVSVDYDENGYIYKVTIETR